MTFDVFGIGNPLLDIVIEASNEDILAAGLKKGIMHLTQADKILFTLGKFSSRIKQTAVAGSCANTMIGVALLGGKAAFSGCIGADDHGSEYAQQLSQHGVENFLINGTGMTGRALCLVSPDSERTMLVHLGAATSLLKDHVNRDAISDSKILHVEGYQFCTQGQRDAAVYAMQTALAEKTIVSLDVSDPEVVRANKSSINNAINRYVDILFANEDEARVLTGRDAENAARELSKRCRLVAVKLDERGSIIAKDGRVINIDSFRADAVDTTGAGDMYAAGLLYGICVGMDIETAGRLASFAAAKVVDVYGARPACNLVEELKRNNLYPKAASKAEVSEAVKGD
ncbi:hypothetical protein COT48_02630 [Candidatus Woesearchaeota archaeon CG08_land_8_20_14_0_20_47_9]|nr:MAG: hypothetical protein AUJ69_02365 [Candidatus Woesearchaeota archaeon CG1_02_47_18]PIN72567.1 MAG: hypothetical protein COV22_02890 [Candidatus Woesearchaeota archaeon CG10_big_fil_rev_8_21_14_0_10_47_5]PIO04001.1 MAG: hypothetical protein COT48_02630 [Candidatus Woesearchaeota archaeon CG08_land_8_20_14_0_20_47_9]HII29489.1 adenosine kinase [Candidatus Woesearchaeota archaeon]